MKNIKKRLLGKLSRLVRENDLRAKYYKTPIDPSVVIRNFLPNIKMSLDIGSGPNPRNPFAAEILYGLDIRSWDINSNIKRCLLGKDPIPFEDNFFDTITAFDVLEHIPRVGDNNHQAVFPFISAMNEIWRVLKVGGIFYSHTPCFPMKEAFQDPTHVNIMTEDTLKYYFGESAWARIYGFTGSFSIVDEGWSGSHYFCFMQKTTDLPLSDMNGPQSVNKII